jgi:hypothetical protein
MITSSQHSVSTTRVSIAAINTGYRTVSVHVIGNGAIYLGDSTVTAANGFYLDKGAGPFQFLLGPQDELYAITSSGTQTMTVLTVGP